MKIASLIVTYHNSENIIQLLDSLINQTYPLDEVIVYDNNSSDSTPELVKKYSKKVTLFESKANIGLGGAQAYGINYAFNQSHDWIWLLDGDSLPDLSALEELISALKKYDKDFNNIGVIASSPQNKSSGMKYPPSYWRNRLIQPNRNKLYSKEPFLVDTVISSGSLLNLKIINRIGLPREDFFIDFIDHEYNLRMRKAGYLIIYVPTSIVYHTIGDKLIDTNKFSTFTHIGKYFGKDFNYEHTAWRYYYQIRNITYFCIYILRSIPSLLFFIIKIIMILGDLLIFPKNNKIKCSKYVLMGFFDGIVGKLGKRVEPK